MLKRDLFAGQDDKQGVNHSGWPHAKQHWEPKATNGKEIDHQVDPKGLRQSHLSEDAQRGNEQGNDDPKDVSAGHQRKHGGALVLAITT
ncbi:MAG: hypothetical protein ACPF90_04530 [Synechococcus sp.]